MPIYYINNDIIDLNHLGDLIRSKRKIALSEECRKTITQCREYLDRKIEETTEPIYMG